MEDIILAQAVPASGFDFWQEVASQAIGSAFALLALVLGAWLTFVRSLKENRRKQVAELEAELEKQKSERRETYVTETLVTAYRDLEMLFLRDSPLFLGHAALAEYRLKAEKAIRDIQLLGDRASAELARKMAADPRLLKDPATVQALFLSMRGSLRARLGLAPLSEVPAFLRFFDDDVIVTMDDAALEAMTPGLAAHKAHLLAQRDLRAGSALSEEVASGLAYSVAADRPGTLHETAASYTAPAGAGAGE